ncbi:MAG: hypothetical protein IKN53_07470, partial [Oscillibacter sp.]|nr:hypothetical protein [Oscillibacter sp.]
QGEDFHKTTPFCGRAGFRATDLSFVIIRVFPKKKRETRKDLPRLARRARKTPAEATKNANRHGREKHSDRAD